MPVEEERRDRNTKLEWGCPNGTKYPPRQPIQTPQVMRLKSFYLTAHFYLTAQSSTDRRTDRQGDSSIPPYLSCGGGGGGGGGNKWDVQTDL